MSVASPIPLLPNLAGWPAEQRPGDGPRSAGGPRHVHRIPERAARLAAWPAWAAPELVARWREQGIDRLWLHQAEAAELAWRGRSTVISTGTASGKSLAYLLPVLSGALSGCASAIYLSPTKALAADQLRRIRQVAPPTLSAAAYDGDCSAEDRAWARAHADVLLTNPDMLHCGLLPAHERWAGFLGRLRFVVLDECHVYRGLFGSHVAMVIRRLRRLCRHHGSNPVFLLASATVSTPEESAARLVGTPVTAVTTDGSPRGGARFVLWEPPASEFGTGQRRGAIAETAMLLAELVAGGARTVAFVRSRKAAEVVAGAARRRLAELAPERTDQVAAYRGGYLPEERRGLERALHDGRLLGLAATSALELGVDVSGLDAVVLCGFPGRISSMWQQAGRAGRAGRPALAVLVARDDPLDTYLVRHPAALFGRPVEATVLDPDNSHVIAPHLCAAAQELALTQPELAQFGPAAPSAVAELVAGRMLRARANGWYWARRGRAVDLVDLRGAGGSPVAVVEQDTGRLLGTVDAAAAPATVHPGAIYVHQGDTYQVAALDLEDGVALADQTAAEFTTMARSLHTLRVLDWTRGAIGSDASWRFAAVEVTSRVTGFARLAGGSGEVVGEQPLDLPPQLLRTKAVCWTASSELLARAGVPPAAQAGAAHAAEHACIGMLPLLASCDRWDVGGVSTPMHPDTGRLSVFVFDGVPGGAGFAERGYSAGRAWLTATYELLSNCECAQGCPACVQSPKCGSGNTPLDKAGARRLLAALLNELTFTDAGAASRVRRDNGARSPGPGRSPWR